MTTQTNDNNTSTWHLVNTDISKQRQAKMENPNILGSNACVRIYCLMAPSVRTLT
jgi:hypothetical protein